MIRVSSEVSRLEKLKRDLKAKYSDGITVHFSLSAFDNDVAIGACLFVYYGSSVFRIKIHGIGYVTYEYNYLSNPNRVVVMSGTSVDNFGKKLKQELHRRNKKLQ